MADSTEVDCILELLESRIKTIEEKVYSKSEKFEDGKVHFMLSLLICWMVAWVLVQVTELEGTPSSRALVKVVALWADLKIRQLDYNRDSNDNVDSIGYSFFATCI